MRFAVGRFVTGDFVRFVAIRSILAAELSDCKAQIAASRRPSASQKLAVFGTSSHPKLFPHSHLWRIDHARKLAKNRHGMAAAFDMRHAG